MIFFFLRFNSTLNKITTDMLLSISYRVCRRDDLRMKTIGTSFILCVHIHLVTSSFKMIVRTCTL